MALWRALFLAGLVTSVISGCSAGKSDSPYIFLPKQVAEDGTDLEAMRVRYCHGQNVTIDGDVLTKENIRAVYDCANYDGKISAMGPLLTNEQFPAFLQNVNKVLQSSEQSGMTETLRSWLEEGPEGSSRADRLLPILASVIKSPSFQDGLPLLSAIFNAGEGVWNDLLPGLAEVVYQERYPDNFDDIFNLFKDTGAAAATTETNYAKKAKDWANFLKSPLGDKTVAMRALEVADDVRNVKMGNTTPQEYLDQANEKGVFVSIFLETGAVRGEQLDPSLNAQPTPGEVDDGPADQTPEQRRTRAYQKLFARGPKGERPPIMDLIALVDEFQKDHKDFVPAFGRWFKANGTRIGAYLSEYVVKAQLSAGLKSISVASYLSDYADSKSIDIDEPMEAEDFVKFLQGAFADAKFSEWLQPQIDDQNTGQLGPKNGKLLEKAPILAQVLEIYSQPGVSAYGAEIVKANPEKSLDVLIRKFSSLHRDNAQFVYKDTKGSLNDHILTAWFHLVNDTLGENVVMDFVIPLVATVVEEATAGFGKDGRTLSEWYFSSPYANPATTEMLAGYAFNKFNLLEKYHQNYDYLMNKLPEEVFKTSDAAQDAANKRAYRALLGQLPNIWLYWRSGMSRSGNDLTRAMASKDKGYLIKNYVALLVNAYGNGFAEKVVDLMGAYMRAFPESLAQKSDSDELEDRRKASLGADSLKRVLRSFFRPEVKGNYDTSTLGRLLQPLSNLVGEQKRTVTERFILTSADEILRTPDDKINDFFRDFGKNAKPADGTIDQRRTTMHALSDAMKKPEFPSLVRQVNSFFQADAVKPALDYLAKRIDDGALSDVLRFIRRVLGFKGK